MTVCVGSVFTGKTPSWTTPLPEIKPFLSGLNESQLEAIRFALASKDLALIHGPPGTGKTTTVVEFILQAVTKYNMKVLVCAPSNIAVDNVLEKLANTCARTSGIRKMQLTRVGHPARVLPQILKYCLDAKIEAAEGTEIVNDIRKEMASMQTKLSKTRDKSLRYNLRREMKANRKEIRQREQNVVVEIVKHSDVVFATNVGASSKLLKDMVFDLVIIDEAAQALEASCWIPILKSKRCVLAGDHLQLPPTIKSKVAASQGLEVTLFDRITRFPTTQSIVKMLNVQYRMHEDISNWCSRAMYNGELGSFEGVAKRKLHELPHVNIDKDDDLLNATLLLLDTAGCELEEDQGDDDAGGNSMLKMSKSNEGEARVVSKHIRALLQAGLREEEIAIITPYNKQVQALKALLLESFPRLEIRSVDGFQGCEKEAVVMSLVRSNGAKEVGFLADDRRMNVAITRAKRHVAVVCDTDTIRAHKFLDNMVKHFEEFGEYRSAQEYLDDDLVHGEASAEAFVAVSVTEGSIESKASRSSSQSASSTAKPKKATPANNSKNEQRKQGQTNQAKPAQKPSTKTSAPSAADADDSTPQRGDSSEVESKAAPSPIPNGDQIHDLQDEQEEEGWLESKQSVFQAMADSSDSSSESEHEDEPPAAVAREAQQSANELLKDLHLSRLARQPPAAPAAAASKKNKKKKKKGGKGTGAAAAAAAKNSSQTAPIPELKDGEDELEFLTRQASSSSACSFQGGASRCKKSVTMLGSICKFCNLKFCYDHAQPEVHGCGDAVRKFERTRFQEQMARPVDDKRKPLSADKRKLLKKKLEEKVGEKTAGRSAKAKGKKK